MAKYKLTGQEYVSPKSVELPMIIKLLGPKTYVTEFAHYLNKQVGYQDCTVTFVDRKKKAGTCVHCDNNVKSRRRYIWDLQMKRDGEWQPIFMRMNPTSHNNLEQVTAAMALTGRKCEECALELRIGKVKGVDKRSGRQYEYEAYEFKLHEADQPPPAQPSEPTAFDTAPAPTPTESEELMTATDEMILAKNAKHIFDPTREWTKTTLTAAFHLELKAEPYNIDDEQHAVEVATYVLENLEELKKKHEA